MRNHSAPQRAARPRAGRPQWSSAIAHICFFLLFAAVLFAAHANLIDLPYFWDELGQFIPAALDIYSQGALIPKSTLPNVHPPGVMIYLAGVWKVFGYSVENTRMAMLALASAGVLFVFMLAVQMCRPLGGLPAFSAVVLLVASPLFYTQSMMAQLDMPAMVFTALAIFLFFEERYAAAAAACTILVLMKETSITTPAVLGAWLFWERRWRPALLFVLPAIALGLWLAYLWSATGHIFGNREFTHYNLAFQLHPVRLPLTLLRRAFYLFIDNFHWIGTLAIIASWRKTATFRTRRWAVIGGVFLAQTLIVTVLGGAALERYLMPVLPLFYIAVAAAFTTLKRRTHRIALTAMAAGLVASLFLPAVFPYPYENSLAVVDFVKLQKEAAGLIEAQYAGRTVASAWPFPDALRRPEFGYVAGPIKVRGLDNFNTETVLKLKSEPVDVLVLYSRTWEPEYSVFGLGFVRQFLADYYFYEPQITGNRIEAELGMVRIGRFERRGQWLEIYARTRTPDIMIL
jgi:4-amino-4-deoxy-L-arabinose transferase-like glycosyltransferase